MKRNAPLSRPLPLPPMTLVCLQDLVAARAVPWAAIQVERDASRARMPLLVLPILCVALELHASSASYFATSGYFASLAATHHSSSTHRVTHPTTSLFGVPVPAAVLRALDRTSVVYPCSSKGLHLLLLSHLPCLPLLCSVLEAMKRGSEITELAEQVLSMPEVLPRRASQSGGHRPPSSQDLINDLRRGHPA